ncbi:dihydroneopterin aldolase [soil metagenome]
MDRITLSGMRFEGRHGVSEEERLFPQLFEVDLEVEVDLAPASRSDALADTTDYGPLIDAARRTVEEGSYRLLEAVAGSLADAVLRLAPGAMVVTVRVRKLAVPMAVDMDHAQVELRRERGGDGPGIG